MPRKYQLKARAEKQEETRRRIVDATFRLHATIGPAVTTVAGIAQAAGVERLTVYRHFPDMRLLFQACAAHGLALHPLPEPGRWHGDLRTGLAQTYAYYRENERMVATILRDREAGAPVGGRLVDYMERAAAAIAHAWPDTPGVRAAIGHAVDFQAWRTLAVKHGLPDAQAVDLMASLVQSAAAAAG